jgi:hypothetical protein
MGQPKAPAAVSAKSGSVRPISGLNLNSILKKESKYLVFKFDMLFYVKVPSVLDHEIKSG